ncbi:MAG: DUF835 domain-containing protein, partial [Thermoplasmata archaeon]|nr:DUF835 domain-containing protein [Thermoplasmata archaeon]
HILSKVLILLLILFYFFPTMFAFLSPSLFLGGVAIWIMGILFAVVIAVVAKLMYDKMSSEIPSDHLMPPTRRVSRRPAPVRTASPAGVSVVVQQPGQVARPRQTGTRKPAKAAEPTGPPCLICKKPVTDFLDLVKCKCGQLFHQQCAEVAVNCVNCGTALVEVEEKGPEMMEAQCPTCGEVNKLPEGVDLMTEKCKACGVIMETVETGFNYLVICDEHEIAYELFVSMLKKGNTGLAISTTFPDKLRKSYDMSQSDIVWLTDTSVQDQKTINPHRLEFEMMRMYAGFVKGNPKSVVMLDGFEYLVVENGFEKVFKFIKKVNDLSSVNSATLFVPIGTDSLEPDQLGTLKKEFDKVVDMSDED